ncbi:hypothetical protein DH2020_048689 [Rehmannia glutinosa]|uniref:DUF3741 domain-containing protein n=1 Tax=Rehmannia glutinosa TaxID=99300 RepID=A0ABR0U4Z9_REHGL
MGREWLHWVAGGGGGAGVGRPSARRRRLSSKMVEEEEETSSAAGCMCAVFQMFDLQQHPFSFQPNTPFLQEEATSSKGVEAPRNSLELDEPSTMKASSSKPLAMKEEENSNFPVGIQIKTRIASNSRTEDNFPSSDCSPGLTKTPNLVARLMGLDLLPECNSPSFSSSIKPPTKSHFNQNHPKKDTNILHTPTRSKKCFSDDDITIGARSSSARRSDFEYHRLSLQINKENTNEEFAISAKMRGKRAKSRQDENRSPAGHFAKQIVSQIKESVSKRVALMDTTNTNYRDKEEIIRRDQNLVPTKRNLKILPKMDGEISTDEKQSITPSCSPKIRFLDTKKNKTASSDINYQVLKDSKKVGGGNGNISSGVKKLQLGPQSSGNSIRNQKDEPFVRSAPTSYKANLTEKKKTKKSPLLSSEILNISGPTLLPVKKDPSPPATKLPQKQSQPQVSDALSSKRNTQLSCNPSHSYSHQKSTVLPDNTNGCATTSSAAEYKSYVQKILKRAGINGRFTPLTLGKWHTPSHPLDPSIFYYLELFHPAASSSSAAAVLSRRCNRKLIFQLTDELLAEILKPHFDFKKWVTENDHFCLADELCKKIESFPAADCRVLEDIDFLIDKDFCKSRFNGFFLEEEGERLVCEIEGEIVESLVRETVAVVVGGGDRTEEEEQGRQEADRGHVVREGYHVTRCH